LKNDKFELRKQEIITGANEPPDGKKDSNLEKQETSIEINNCKIEYKINDF